MSDHRQNLDRDTAIAYIDHGVCSHIGQRSQNQDCHLAISGGWGSLFAVADGMGGHAGGALASRLACEQLNEAFVSRHRDEEWSTPDALSRHLVEAVIRADRFIRRYGRGQGDLADMGTTLSCLLFAGDQGVIAHVGDSRIYRWRKGHLSLLTVDHTFIQDMIFEGELAPSDALFHPFRHMLTRTLGTVEPLEFVDSRLDQVKTGDRFLLCTDGLTNTLSDNSILEALEAPSNAASIANGLVERAIARDARDNVTAIVVCLWGWGESAKP